MYSIENRAEIISIRQFVALEAIRIPEYQRPYKWTAKNVLQLVDDIHTFRKKSHYRFGTIVIHINTIKENDGDRTCYDIVDGQQRYITLRLLIYTLQKLVQNNPKYQSHTKELVAETYENVKKIPITFKHKLTIENISANFRILQRAIQHYDDETITQFITNFQVVAFYIHDETEAFQFFDSQNSRGKDLYPHDLLKAYHLREFDAKERAIQTEIIDQWERYATHKLHELFSEYLFRIKGWSNSQSSRYFKKEHIDSFKGISIDKIEEYPYVKGLQIAHHLVDNYNANVERKIDKQKMDFPFQIDQLMINGRRFFEYISYYLGINERFKATYLKPTETLTHEGSRTELLVNYIYHNKFSYRDGESYLKDLFECVTIFYIDKFGNKEIDSFIEKAFVWTYYLRFEFQRLGFDSIDKYVLNNNLFLVIKNAIHPKEVVKSDYLTLPTLQKIMDFEKEESRRMDQKIVKFFKDNNYYAN